MNLLELVQAQFTDERLSRLAAIVGESALGTRKALSGAVVPALLAGLSGEYAGDAGAARLLELMRAGGHDGAFLANLDGALAGGAHTDALLNLGKGQLGAILGDRVDAVSELVAADTGIRRHSAVALLGLVVPVVLGVLGKQLQAGGGAARIAGLLAGARPALAAIASPGLPAALGVANLAAAATPAASLTTPQRQGAVWPWLIVPAVTLAMFFSLRSCQQSSMQVGPGPAAPVTAPATTPAVPTAPAADPLATGAAATPAVPSSSESLVNGPAPATADPQARDAAAAVPASGSAAADNAVAADAAKR